MFPRSLFYKPKKNNDKEEKEEEEKKTEEDIISSFLQEEEYNFSDPSLFDPKRQQQWDNLNDFIAKEVKPAPIRDENINFNVATGDVSSVYCFPLFDSTFCGGLTQEIKDFVQKHKVSSIQGLEGIPIKSFKGGPKFFQEITNRVAPLASFLYSGDNILYNLDPYHIYVVYYGNDERGVNNHAVHVDDCDLTLNISLSNAAEGGDLFYFNQSGNIQNIDVHPIGSAIMHLGKLPHGVNDVIKGDRYHLIMWFKRGDTFHNFNSLPPLIIQHSLIYLSPFDLIHFGQTCKEYHKLSESKELWEPLYKKYFVEGEIQKLMTGTYKGQHASLPTPKEGNYVKDGFRLAYDACREPSLYQARRIFKEIVDTEVTYVESITFLCTNYYKPLIEWNSKAKEKFSQFYLYTEKILQNHQELLVKSQHANSTFDYSELCASFLSFKSRVNNYIAYITKYEELAKLVKQEPFASKIKKMQIKYGVEYEMSSHIIAPVRRLPRYMLLLNELKKTLAPGLQQCQATHVTNEFHKLTLAVNEAIKNNNNNTNNNNHNYAF